MTKPVLALDFDGVICNSITECLVSAFNGYARTQGKDDWVHSPNEIDHQKAELFHKYRHFCRPAKEFWVLVHWLQNNETFLDEKTFVKIRADHAKEIDRFENIFFEARTDLRNENPENWINLHPRYQESIEDWSQILDKFELYLVTTKDLASVRVFNEKWNLNFIDDHLYTKDRARSKPWAIERIAERCEIKPEDIIFVDDHPDHLKDVAKTGARCYWSSWGYHKHLENLEGFPGLKKLKDLLLLI